MDLMTAERMTALARLMLLSRCRSDLDCTCSNWVLWVLCLSQRQVMTTSSTSSLANDPCCREPSSIHLAVLLFVSLQYACPLTSAAAHQYAYYDLPQASVLTAMTPPPGFSFILDCLDDSYSSRVNPIRPTSCLSVAENAICTR